MKDDVISRQAAIDALGEEPKVRDMYEHPSDYEYDLATREQWKYDVACIAEVPSAERKGKWIYLDGLDAFECSVCGRQMVRNIFDYCPWCGSRNKEEEKE